MLITGIKDPLITIHTVRVNLMKLFKNLAIATPQLVWSTWLLVLD